MAINPNNTLLPSWEQQGSTPPGAATVTVAATPPVIPSDHLDWMMSTMARLESRLAAIDRRPVDHRVPPRPDPDPPYALPLSAAVRETQLHQQPLHSAVNEFHTPPQPFLTSTHFPEITTHTRPPPHGFRTQQPQISSYQSQPFPQRFHPPFYESDNPGQPRPYLSHAPPDPQILPPSTGFGSQFDQPFYTNLPGPRPTSCWYPSADRPPRNSPFQDQHRSVRMDPPRFDGSDAANWIFKIQYYFDHMMMPDANRLHYVVPLFDPPASEWIKHYCSNNDYVTWQDFLNEVRYRFDPDCYESYIGLIAKLCQTGTVSEYQLEFERLQNKLSGVPDYILLPIYIAGLKQPLQREVKLHRPTTLAAAFALAKELSACRQDQLPFPHVPSQQPNSSAQGARPSDSHHRSRDMGKLPVVRLSASEKSERSRRGLCWYCEDKWAPGHVCKHKFLAYMGVNADEDDVAELENELPEDNIITADLSHLDTVDARKRSRSFHMHGSIQHMAVTILVDNGSSNNFIHPTIAEKLSLPLTPIQPFRVYVGNGESLVCSHVSKQPALDLQGHIFHIDLNILAFHGPDIILGMEWLESLGRVTHDYLARTMEFFRDGAQVLLRGLSTFPPRISATALTTLMSHTDDLDLFELVEIPTDQPIDQLRPRSEFPQDLHPPVLHDVSQFSADSASQTVVPLPAELFMSRPIYKPIRLLERRVVIQHGQPVEHGLFQWSDSVYTSPTFPSFILEDKDDSMEGGVDKSSTLTTIERTPSQGLQYNQADQVDRVSELVAHEGLQSVSKTK